MSELAEWVWAMGESRKAHGCRSGYRSGAGLPLGGGGRRWHGMGHRQRSWPAANARCFGASLLLCSTCCLRDHSSAALRKSTARAIYKMGMQTLSIMNSFLIACVEARETVRDV